MPPTDNWLSAMEACCAALNELYRQRGIEANARPADDGLEMDVHYVRLGGEVVAFGGERRG